jgi:hypothetical protein
MVTRHLFLHLETWVFLQVALAWINLQDSLLQQITKAYLLDSLHHTGLQATK